MTRRDRRYLAHMEPELLELTDRLREVTRPLNNTWETMLYVDPKCPEARALLGYLVDHDFKYEGESQIPYALKKFRKAREDRSIHMEYGDDGLGNGTDYTGRWDKYWKASEQVLQMVLYGRMK